MPIIQRPAALGLLLCDQLIIEQRTQKPSAIGIFTGITTDRFPSSPQRLDVFAALTDGLGDGTIDLLVTQLEGDQQIFAQSMEMTFPDPLKVVNVRFRFRQLSFPSPGVYVFALVVDGEEIAQRRIHVYQGEEPS